MTEKNNKIYFHYSLSIKDDETNETKELIEKNDGNEVISILKEKGFILESFEKNLILENKNDIYIGFNPYMWHYNNIRKIIIEKTLKDLEKTIDELYGS